MPDAIQKTFYVAFIAGGDVLKCAGQVGDERHEEFYRNYFGRFGHGMDWPRRTREEWEREPIRFRVVVLPDYMGDRIVRREGKYVQVG